MFFPSVSSFPLVAHYRSCGHKSLDFLKSLLLFLRPVDMVSCHISWRISSMCSANLPDRNFVK